MEEETTIQLRIYPGPPQLPVLVYLPGLHGDWTLVGSFRKALASRMRFVEVTYPRTLTWDLSDYARHIAAALTREGIEQGWLLAESFGSQVGWAMLDRGDFKVQGVVLAGGFARHPLRWGVRLAQWLAGNVPLRVIVMVLFGYAKIARMRFRKSPEVGAGIQEFIARRTKLDLRAASHRLHLIFQNNPTQVVRSMKVPLFAINGMLDPVVPWVVTRRWLRKHCGALRAYAVFAGADHNVLGTAPQKSADQVLEWLSQTGTRDL